MTLSVDCPQCGKQFRNLNPDLAGKKARCRCGAVVRLGAVDAANPRSKQDNSSAEPSDLLNVDLLGLEMMGDQMLGGDLLESDRSTNVPVVPQPDQQEPGHRKSSKSKPNQIRSDRKPRSKRKSKSEPKPAKTPRVRRGPTANVSPEVALEPPGGSKSSGSKKSGRQSKPGSRSKLRGEPTPEVPLILSPSKPKSGSKPERPIFEQTYGDLDDILAGAGDASPLMARPRPTVPDEPNKSLRTQAVASEQKSGGRNSSTLGFLAALGSATLAIWFGLFVVASRFQVIDSFLLRGFSIHLQSVFSTTFGDSDVPSTFQVTFTLLGWLVWCLAVAMILMAITQFVNAFVKLLTERQPVRWADGVIGAMGVAAVFVLVAITFCETSYARHEHQTLDVYEQPFADEGEKLANVTRLRAEIDKRDRSFTINMLGGATIPMAIFVLSMIRLFATSSEESS